MIDLISFSEATRVLRHETAIAIPVYLPPGPDHGRGATLLEDTARAFAQQVENPANVCLSVDGEDCGAEFAARLAQQLGVCYVVAPVNRGKLQGASNGVQALLDRANPRYIAVVDQDGDHFANELANLVRAAAHVAQQLRTSRILVVGTRTSRHRPMGFLRGELEELADRLLLDALHYHAALADRPLRLEYATLQDEFPDFHSGYKLFSRATARDVFLSEPQMAGVSEAGYCRHACEAVMLVEAMIRGAHLATVRRSTLNEQPISTFDQFSRTEMTANQIVWPCRRLGVPPRFVEQWMANHLPRLLLNTLAPHGQAELRETRELVLRMLGQEGEGDTSPPIQPSFL